MIIISAQAFPPRTGGIQNLLAGTAEYIAKSGHEVLVLADGGQDAKAWEKTANLPYRVEWFSGPRPLRRWRKARRLETLVRRGGVDAVYADTWKSIEKLKSGLPCPVVTWAHGNEFPNVGKKTERIKAAFRKASHIVFNSEETRDRASAFTPENVPFSIVHPPIFDPVEPVAADAERVEAVWGNHHPRLLSTCRLIDWKGVDQAILSMPAVLEIFPNAKLAIAGIGDDRARLETIVDDLQLQTSVEFLGWIEDSTKTALQRSADLFLQPGRQVIEEREGYGITYVEAALQGLPTICGDAGGAPEAIIDGETGLKIDATRTENVSGAILGLISNPTRHKYMCENSRAHGLANLWRNRVASVLAPTGLTPLRDLSGGENNGCAQAAS